MPVTLAVIGVVAAVAGTAVAVKGQMDAATAAAQAQEAQGQRDARAAEAQARLSERDVLVFEQEAVQEGQALAIDIDTLTRQFRRLRGQQEVAVGAGGIEFAGSPLDILAETAAEGQFEIERISFESGERQRQLRDEASQSEFEASELRLAGIDAIAVSRSRARETRRAGRSRAIGTGISGFGQVLGAASRFGGGGITPGATVGPGGSGPGPLLT